MMRRPQRGRSVTGAGEVAVPPASPVAPGDADVTSTGGGTAPGSVRRNRLRSAATSRGVPLLTILTSVAVVVGVYLTGRLAYRLRDVLLLVFIGGFLALILNPFVLMLQRAVHRRGMAVGVVVLLGALVFIGLVAAFGYPLSSAMTHLARQIPIYVADAQKGRGMTGRIVQHFHLQKWVSTNAPKLQDLGSSLGRPALAIGKGAVVLIGEILAVLTLVVLLLLEGPRLRAGALRMMSAEHGAWCIRVATRMRQAVVGYVVGDLLTSLVAGVVVGVTMAALGLPFPLLWAVWVALVDFLPQIGGALAGIPTVLFAAVQSIRGAAILAVVFIAYQQIENHFLNPVVMSKTVRTSPLLIFLAVLVGGSIGGWIGGAFGAFFAALLAVPTAASLQILGGELWRLWGGEGEAEAASLPAD